MATPSSSTLRRALFAKLRSIAQGQDGRARVYALGSSPAGGTPDLYITWNRVDSVHERHLAGGAGLVHARYDVNCWARRLADAEALSDVIRIQLDNHRGPIGDAQDSALVQSIALEGSEQSFEPDAAGGWHRIRLDLLIWSAETISGPDPGILEVPVSFVEAASLAPSATLGNTSVETGLAQFVIPAAELVDGLQIHVDIGFHTEGDATHVFRQRLRMQSLSGHDLWTLQFGRPGGEKGHISGKCVIRSKGTGANGVIAATAVGVAGTSFADLRATSLAGVTIGPGSPQTSGTGDFMTGSGVGGALSVSNDRALFSDNDFLNDLTLLLTGQWSLVGASDQATLDSIFVRWGKGDGTIQIL